MTRVDDSKGMNGAPAQEPNDIVEDARAARDRRRAALNLMEDAIIARREAEGASRAKDEFLATLGHELRTPLTAIVLWTQAIRSRSAAPDDDLARALAAIDQSAQAQTRLIDDLLDLSRLASGRFTLVPSRAGVRGLIESATDAVRPLAAAKRIALVSEISMTREEIIIDATRVTQIVWNLLTNAIKFTGFDGTVWVCAQKRGNMLEVSVTDDGEGIAPDFLPYVFDKFRQADMGESRPHMGLGIGLALAKELVELQGGTIEAASDGLQQGATFLVRLPWVAAEPKASTDDAAARTPSCALDSLRVLVVDDDASTLDALRAVLEHAGAKVTTALNGMDALVRLEGADVLVSDLALPGMSGFELVRCVDRWCRERGLRAMPACAISAHTSDADRRRAIDAGFDAFLAKPVAAARLVEAVGSLRDLLETAVEPSPPR